jgi:hypothetical protein
LYELVRVLSGAIKKHHAKESCSSIRPLQFTHLFRRSSSATRRAFRNDVNVNGVISNTDVSVAKTQVGAALPP